MFIRVATVLAIRYISGFIMNGGFPNNTTRRRDTYRNVSTVCYIDTIHRDLLYVTYKSENVIFMHFTNK